MSGDTLDRFREQEDDAWSVDSSHTDTSSIVHSPQRPLLNAELYSRIQRNRGRGPQLLRQDKGLDAKAPLAMAQTVVVLPRKMHIPLPEGVSFDPSTMSFQGIDDVDMSGFDDSDDENDEPRPADSTGSPSDSSSGSAGSTGSPAAASTPTQRNPTPQLTRKKTPPPPLRPPAPIASDSPQPDPHNRRSSMSEFVIDAAMREALFESQRRHNVMLMALVGFEDYQHILSNGRRLLNEKFARNVHPRTSA